MKVLTLNSWGVSGPPERLHVLLEAIRAAEAAIVCLQEAVQPELLEPLPYPHRAHSPEAGLAILSHFPILSQRHPIYSVVSPHEPYRRQALLAEVELPAGLLWVVNTHLAWKAADEASRQAQVEELLALVHPLRNRVLLAGDFNAEPHHAPIAKIVEGGFVDLFAHLHPGSGGGVTWDNRNPYIQSHTVKFPDRRIDYLFLHGETLPWLMPESCEVVCQKPNPQGFFPSDHYGVLAAFSLKSL